MQFRFCCTCKNEDNAKPTVENREIPTVSRECAEAVTPTIQPPKVITQQPKHAVEPIQLDRITEVSFEGSSIQTTEEEPIQKPKALELIPAKRTPNFKEDSQPPEESDKNVDNLYKQLLNLVLAEKAKVNQQYNPPVNETPSITAETIIDNEKLTLSEVTPDLYKCAFRGSYFYIIQGDIQDYNSILNESDRTAIKIAYKRIMEAMQIGLRELKGGVYGQGPSAGSTINTNYINRRGENDKMFFRALGKGYFVGRYEGREFTIRNGQLLESDGGLDAQDRELILQTYKNTIIGMEQGLMNIQKSVQLNEVGATGSGLAIAQAGSLATGRDTLTRMRSLNHGKRISLLEGGLIAQPRQPVMLIEDISDKPKILKYFDDEVDGSKSTEPVLQKTTFTPQAVIYDDPKTYETQDHNELPPAKQLDDYIISMDENFNSENRYHFHKARPKRVTRNRLNPKEKLRLASPERYALFESECLKLHNQYRKMHGVPPLVHNEFLSQVAKEWAEHLALTDAFYHRPKNEYGENLYYVEGMPCRARMAVKAWYDEIDLYDYENPKFSREVGHFTQLVWKDTREVGTGVAQIGDKVWVCCNYHPAGNYLDKMNDEFVPRPVMKAVKRN